MNRRRILVLVAADLALAIVIGKLIKAGRGPETVGFE